MCLVGGRGCRGRGRALAVFQRLWRQPTNDGGRHILRPHTHLPVVMHSPALDACPARCPHGMRLAQQAAAKQLPLATKEHPAPAREPSVPPARPAAPPVCLRHRRTRQGCPPCGPQPPAEGARGGATRVVAGCGACCSCSRHRFKTEAADGKGQLRCCTRQLSGPCACWADADVIARPRSAGRVSSLHTGKPLRRPPQLLV